MPTSPDKKFHDLLQDFGNAMLVTRTAEGKLRGRPMALAEAEPDGTLWFATDRDSAKIDELEKDDQVVVTMQSGMKYLSLTGRAKVVDDRAKAAQLWKAEWKVWYPGGKDDPALVLLRIDGETGEYWDNSGTGGVKYLIEAGKALLTGSRPDVQDDAKVHAKVEL
ncbi:Pyridoxamine 5'-phosphate oxidase [Aquisphaera giovannonii]|uniref:Pyridoxamine 5'-phosphate oxidase n=1 Tax=Aquisphaera giovannonii TaxID=406548 RepID=A0A5B9W789_9BACT|nr:pyridoxamine 5'-phosphate oxidase family protein [Aquisphaera giovannonii]QEH35800.1 Pyridoxamine 5'-phosphate oxidase [Aquisphaera giovannonii]